jgi:hypothetical protein
MTRISAKEYRETESHDGKKSSARRNKFGAVATRYNGKLFASRKEANRYRDLMLLERSRMISELTTQPSYPIEVNGKLICIYIADFRYRDMSTGLIVVEDCKGGDATKTPVYKIKKKLFEALYPGMRILET